MAVQATNIVTHEELRATLTADYAPSGNLRGRPFIIRVVGTVAPLVVEDAGGREAIITTVTDDEVDLGFSNALLCSKVKHQSADGNTTTGAFSSTNYLRLGFPNYQA